MNQNKWSDNLISNIEQMITIGSVNHEKINTSIAAYVDGIQKMCDSYNLDITKDLISHLEEFESLKIILHDSLENKSGVIDSLKSIFKSSKQKKINYLDIEKKLQEITLKNLKIIETNELLTSDNFKNLSCLTDISNFLLKIKNPKQNYNSELQNVFDFIQNKIKDCSTTDNIMSKIKELTTQQISTTNYFMKLLQPKIEQLEAFEINECDKEKHIETQKTFDVSNSIPKILENNSNSKKRPKK